MAGYVRNHMFFALSTVVMLAVSVYAAFRLVLALDMSLWLKVVLSSLIVISSQSISFMRFIVTMKPGMSFLWLRVGGYISALFMTLVSLTFLRDAALVSLWLLEKLGLDTCGHFFAIINSAGVDAAMLGGSVLFAAVGMWYALKVPGIKEVEIGITSLPEELDGLRLAQLTDLHIGSTFDAAWLSRVVENTNAMGPDIVLITGDLVDGRPEDLGEDLTVLKNLKSKLGTFISVGNHEYYSGVMPWVNTWRDMGLTVLLNEHRVFEISGKPLVVAGIADPNAAKFPGLVMPDAEGAVKGAPAGFRILMAHQPSGARRHASLGYNLQLSGHTHGGQYFFLFPLTTILNEGFRSGLYEVDGMKLYVSPGTGLWGYVPMRIGSPSEITILTLRAGYK